MLLSTIVKNYPDKKFVALKEKLFIFTHLTHVSTEKKVPPRHQSLYRHFFNADYRKPKVVGGSIFFCIRKLKRYIFASDI
jgi:hypothetical protein